MPYLSASRGPDAAGHLTRIPMKRTLYALCLMVAALAVSAQYYYVPSFSPGNPGGLMADGEYPVGGGLDASWTSIAGPSAATPAWSAPQTIGFPFDFNGSPVTSYQASTTGVVTFSASPGAAPASTPVALPSASVPDQSVCVLGIQASGSNDNVVIKQFGSAGSRQHWIFFSSMTNPTNSSCWHYFAIVLEEGTNNIYVMDMRHACDIDVSIGIQIDASTAYAVAGSPSLGQLAEASPFDDDNFAYTFIPGSQPAYDLSGVSFDGAEFNILADAPFDITGTLVNLGSATITSMDVNYSVDGGTPVTANLTGLSIAPYATYNLTHPTAFNPASDGVYTIEIWASNLNGNADEVPANDRVSGPFGVYAAFTDRVPLYETFTSSTCPPCTPANVTLENLFNTPGNEDKFHSIKYQQDFPGAGDPYYTDEAGALRALYGVNSIPRLEVDGGWDQNAGLVTQALMDEWASVPSFIELSATYEVVGQAIGVEVTVNPLVDIPNPNLVLRMAVFEYETFNNTGSNGETEFFHVMKKMLPDEDGVSIGALTAGTAVTRTGEHEFQGSYRLPFNAGSPINHATEHSVEEFSDLGVIVWVQDASTLEILQSAEAVVDAPPPSGLEAPQLFAGAKLYPNPVRDAATLAFQLTEGVDDLRLTLFAADGRQVAVEALGAQPRGRSTVELQTADLAPGTYVLRLEARGLSRAILLQKAE